MGTRRKRGNWEKARRWELGTGRVGAGPREIGGLNQEEKEQDSRENPGDNGRNSQEKSGMGT